MRLFVIGDEETVVGFRFAGVEGAVVEDAAAAQAALRDAAQRGVAVIVIPERVAGWIRKEIDLTRFGLELPLIVEVPGREGPSDEVPSLFRLIREVIGIEFAGRGKVGQGGPEQGA